MIAPARRISYRLLKRIESGRVFSDDALNSEDIEKLEIRDRHLTTEVVYGVLRWQSPLDYVLAGLSSRPWQEVAPGARILLRMSLYQMWQMDRIPDHAHVNDAVELAKRELGEGIGRYVNGILRNLTRTRPWRGSEFLRDAPPHIQVSLPQWLWSRWAGRYGETCAKEFALSLNVPPRVAVCLAGESAQDNNLPFESVPSDIVPDAFIRSGPEREQGSGPGGPTPFRIQDEASQLIPHLLGPANSGQKIWDACAAPGGKSAILQKICGQNGHLVASDLRWERVLRLAALLTQDGPLKADVLVADAHAPLPFRSSFDAVLADVPCSGLGTLRRNPEIRWHFGPAGLASLQQTQKQIIDNVSEAVRVGGRLLYSTCSTEPEENEQVIESFLNAHPGFSLEQPVYPPGIENWTGQDRMIRTFPGTRLWDGFFAALLTRRQ